MSEALAFISSSTELPKNANYSLEYNSNFRIVEYYINDSDIDVTVKHRNNLSIPVYKQLTSRGSIRLFTLRRSYYFRDRHTITHTLTNINNYLGGAENNDEMNIIKHALSKACNSGNISGNLNIVVDHVIDITSLKDNRSLYDKELDIVLSTTENTNNFPHPFSRDGGRVEEFQDYVRNKLGTGIFIEIVDNSSLINDRYIYIGKDAVRISVHADSSKEPGIYYTLLDHNRLNDVSIVPSYLNYKDAEEKLGIYKTREEALTKGDPDSINKVRLAELSAKELEQKTEIIELKNQQEISKIKYINLKDEYDVLKLKRDEMMDNRKNYYEAISYERKDSHEMLKYLPAIVVSIAAIISLFKK